jgi:predicted DNA-binding transcriptional regulator AlpA
MTYPKKPRTTTAPAPLPSRLYSPGEAALFLGVSMQTLAHWRCKGRGPRFVSLSARCIRYPESALCEWVEKRTQDSTAENGRE